MASSDTGGLVLYNYLLSATDQDPCDVMLAYLAGQNAMHLCDAYAPRHVCIVPLSPSWGIGLPNDGSGSPRHHLYFLSSPVGMRIHPDGSPFKWRVRVAGYETAGSDQTIRVAATTNASFYDDRDASSSEPNVADFTISGSTSSAAWYDASPKYIELPAGDERISKQTIPISAGSSVPTEIQWFPIRFAVWNASSTPTLTCALSGLIIEEFTG